MSDLTLEQVLDECLNCRPLFLSICLVSQFWIEDRVFLRSWWVWHVECSELGCCCVCGAMALMKDGYMCQIMMWSSNILFTPCKTGRACEASAWNSVGLCPSRVWLGPCRCTLFHWMISPIFAYVLLQTHTQNLWVPIFQHHGWWWHFLIVRALVCIVSFWPQWLHKGNLLVKRATWHCTTLTMDHVMCCHFLSTIFTLLLTWLDEALVDRWERWWWWKMNSASHWWWWHKISVSEFPKHLRR